MIRLHKHSEIDFEKWDRCVEESAQPMVYAVSWYLNRVHPGWQALIWEEADAYLAVAPLLGQRRKGVWMHVEPPLAQQLGIFAGDADRMQSLMPYLIQVLREKFGLYRYPLRAANNREDLGEMEVVWRKNYVLDLSKPYETTLRGYRRDRRYRLQMSQRSGYNSREAQDTTALFSLFCEEVIPKIAGGVSGESVERLRAIAQFALQNGLGRLLEAVSPEGEVAGASLFLFHKHRIYYYLSACNEQGRQHHVHTLLVDQVIREYSGEGWIFDFQAPEVPSIADFYLSFGGILEPFPLLRGERWMYKMYLNLRHWHAKTLE
jgi:hypothetical protein